MTDRVHRCFREAFAGHLDAVADVLLLIALGVADRFGEDRGLVPGAAIEPDDQEGGAIDLDAFDLVDGSDAVVEAFVLGVDGADFFVGECEPLAGETMLE